MKKLVIGMLAHVDAGKTTLSEAMLYQSGIIKKLGRVDNKDAFLDNDPLERERGITIFSKQAILRWNDWEITLLDTPGHVDFSTEMERTLQVLDYAILIINARDGIQPHTETLWKLLHRYHIPSFLFINKMDLEDTDREQLLRSLKARFSENCVDFSVLDEAFSEEIAFCDEKAMEDFLENGKVEKEMIRTLISERKVFPCFFGSALRMEGVSELIEGLKNYTFSPHHSPEFSAKVFKIAHDSSGNRLTYMKILGGALKVRTQISYRSIKTDENLEEKIHMIRFYSGAKFETAEEATAGSVCAVLGLTQTTPGQVLGNGKESFEPLLEPVIVYRILLPKEIGKQEFLLKARQLEEEEPQLSIDWDPVTEAIYVHLMGEIQAEIFRRLVLERFGIGISYDEEKIIYKETILSPVEGVGHFEPLRHYAEVHLLLEPGEPGSGLVIESRCREEILDKNWQHLVLTHLMEKTHRGVLIGAQLTDVKISLIAGRAHVKHTEGGDFRQATYRALRQGLMKAKNLLLEPYYAFTLEVPSDQIGRAISDIQNMSGTFSAPELFGETAQIRGRAPVSEMRSYAKEVVAYTKGKGHLNCLSDGYAPCHNEEEIVALYDYNPENDVENTPDSVFCSHGSGTIIKWSEVEKYMHVTGGVTFDAKDGIPHLMDIKLFRRNLNLDEKELEAIMEREFGPIKRRQYSTSAIMDIPKLHKEMGKEKKEYFIVDGYNVIFSWEGLKHFSDENLDGARHMLMDILSNYRGYRECELVLVFDGYKVKDNEGERFDYHGIHIVYTKENETGDMYIEKLIDEIGKNYAVKVVTSDNLIQVAAVRSGVLRMSSHEFREEIEWVKKQIDDAIEERCKVGHYRPFSSMKENGS